MQLNEALARSPVGTAIRSDEKIGSIISSTEHGCYLQRKGSDGWEQRPEFEDRTKGDWQPMAQSNPMYKIFIGEIGG